MTAGTHHLCEELRLARVKRGMSLRQMGSALGLTGDSRGVVILRWETGKTMPRVDSLARWAAALGHDIVLRARRDVQAEADEDLQAELAEDARRDQAAERGAE